jgi:hypothetical protein
MTHDEPMSILYVRLPGELVERIDRYPLRPRHAP